MVRFTSSKHQNALQRSVDCPSTFLTLKGERSLSRAQKNHKNAKMSLAIAPLQMVGFTSTSATEQNVYNVPRLIISQSELPWCDMHCSFNVGLFIVLTDELQCTIQFIFTLQNAQVRFINLFHYVACHVKFYCHRLSYNTWILVVVEMLQYKKLSYRKQIASAAHTIRRGCSNSETSKSRLGSLKIIANGTI